MSSNKNKKNKTIKNVDEAVNDYSKVLNGRVESFTIDLSDLSLKDYDNNAKLDNNTHLKHQFILSKIKMLEGVLNNFVKDYNQVYSACCKLDDTKTMYDIYNLIDEYKNYYWANNHYLLNTYYYKFNGKLLFTIDEMIENAFINNLSPHSNLTLYNVAIFKDLAFNMFHITTSFYYFDDKSKQNKIIFVVLCSVNDEILANKILGIVEPIFKSNEFTKLLNSKYSISAFKKYINLIYDKISNDLNANDYLISSFDLDIKKYNIMSQTKNRSS